MTVFVFSHAGCRNDAALTVVGSSDRPHWLTTTAATRAMPSLGLEADAIIGPTWDDGSDPRAHNPAATTMAWLPCSALGTTDMIC